MSKHPAFEFMSTGHDETNFDIPPPVFEATAAILDHLVSANPTLFTEKDPNVAKNIILLRWDPNVRLLDLRKYGIILTELGDHVATCDIMCDGRVCRCTFEFPPHLPAEVSNGAFEQSLVVGRNLLAYVRMKFTQEMAEEGLKYKSVISDESGHLDLPEMEEAEPDELEQPEPLTRVKPAWEISTVSVTHIGETGLAGAALRSVRTFLLKTWKRAHDTKKLPVNHEWECSWQHLADEGPAELDAVSACITRVEVDLYRLTFIVEDDLGVHECTVPLGASVFTGSRRIAAELAKLLPKAIVDDQSKSEVVRSEKIGEILSNPEERAMLAEQLAEGADIDGVISKSVVAKILQKIMSEEGSRIARGQLKQMIDALVGAGILAATYGDSAYMLQVTAR